MVKIDFEIKANRRYVCIRDLDDNCGNRAFIKGEIYESTVDGTLMPNNSNIPYKVTAIDHYFRPAIEDEIPHEPKFKESL